MKRVLLFVSLAFVFTQAVHARLGETLEELETRFGKGSKVHRSGVQVSPLLAYSFIKNNVRIGAEFIDGKCVRITYQPTGIKTWHFNAKQIQTLIMLNSDGKNWNETNPPKSFNPLSSPGFKPKRSMARADGQVYMHHIGAQLSFITAAYISEMNKRLKAKAKADAQEEAGKNRLEGF